jgi:uncharacterized protein YdbL (DUF1318 family)
MSEPKQFSKKVGAALLLLVLTLAVPAAAQSGRALDAPRAAGQVGERYDGYAVARGAVTSDVTALVSSVNAERRQVYAQRAEVQKAPVDAVGKIYAAEILKHAPAGTWFLSESGEWIQKK